MAESRISKVFQIRTPGGIPSKKDNLRKGREGQGYHYDGPTKQMLDAMVFSARGEWRGLPVLTDVHVGFHFEYSSKRSDPDSWAVSTMDSLKQAGIIRDDSAVHIRGFLPMSWTHVEKFRESVTVTIHGNPAEL